MVNLISRFKHKKKVDFFLKCDIESLETAMEKSMLRGAGIDRVRQNTRKQSKIHCYSGPGKGKSTAAIGLVLRSLGSSPHKKVAIFQFLKGGKSYSEDPAIAALSPWRDRILYQRSGTGRILNATSLPPEDIAQARYLWERAKQAIASGKYAVVILDELNPVLALNIISVEEVIEYLEKRSPYTEIVATGTNPPEPFVDQVHLHSYFDVDATNDASGIYIHTGEGKGKSTASLGRALRCIGQGKQVALIRWLKGGNGYSEDPAINVLTSTYQDLFRHYRCGYQGEIVWMQDRIHEHYREAEKGWYKAQCLMEEGVTCIILDEILPTLDLGLLEEKAIAFSLQKKPKNTKIFLVGRSLRRGNLFNLAKVITTHAKRHYQTPMQGIDF